MKISQLLESFGNHPAPKEEIDLYREEIARLGRIIKQLNDLYIDAKRMKDQVMISNIKKKLAQVSAKHSKLLSDLEKRQSGELAKGEDSTNEISKDTATSYLKKATHDTLTGKKDRNSGMKQAVARLAGVHQPLEHITSEDATAGATSSASIATVPNPHLSPGPARGKKSYTGTPGKSGTKAPPQPKPKSQKPSDNALDMKGTSIFGSPIKR